MVLTDDGYVCMISWICNMALLDYLTNYKVIRPSTLRPIIHSFFVVYVYCECKTFLLSPCPITDR